MMDLTWTGNQFLDRSAHAATILSVLSTMDMTTKDDPWSRSVADATAAHFGLPPDHVRVAAGSTQVLEALLRGAHRGLIVDVTPNFHLAATLARQEGWDYRDVPVREPAGLRAALDPYLDRPDATIVLSSPRNPLGYQFDLGDIGSLVARAAGTVIVDEAYADFAPDTALRMVTAHPNLAVVRTFSKAWGLANLRIGFVASSALPTGRLRLRLIPNAVAGVAHRAVHHLLTHPGAVEESIRSARACRAEMIDALADVPGLLVWPSDANYVCIETPTAAQLVAALGEAGYAVRGLHDLRGYPADWPAGVRVTVPPHPHLDAVCDVVRRSHRAAAPVRGAAG
ncbi:MAG TPA: aminotransferase class I/II-fold pyridoxal phosphate-dependent enzyme [Mycobacteriales bacterium]|nr:aminotransferase class I/II-fold pyridoxal phosphate-dependent enzyme [Mycobacteriales bacterium]